MMLLARDRKVMGKFYVTGPIFVLGWITVLVMTAASVMMILQLIAG